MTMNIVGSLAGVSHLFYLSKVSKVFFIEVKPPDPNEPSVRIVTSLSSRLSSSTRTACRRLLLSPVLGQKVAISHLKTLCLHSTNVLQMSRHSRLELHEDFVDIRMTSREKLVSYRGIVTKILGVGSGHYLLDKKVHLVTSLLCVVTNVPSLTPGQEVTVRRAHLAKYQGSKWLVMCGASFLMVENREEHEESLHPSQRETDGYLANPFINQVQSRGPRRGGDWACHDLLTLWDNYQVAEISLGANCILDRVLELTFSKNEERVERSLAREFICHDMCPLEGEGAVVKPLASLSIVKELTEKYREFNDNSDDQPVEKNVEFLGGVQPIIIGFIGFNDLGRMVIKDQDTSILVVGDWSSLSSGSVVEIQKFTIGVEPSLSYLIVQKYRKLENITKISAKVEGKVKPFLGTKTVDVLIRSPVISGKFFLIYCSQQEEGKCLIRIENVEKWHVFQPGFRIVLNSQQETCFERLDLSAMSLFNILPLIGQVPCFVLRKDTTEMVVQDGTRPIRAYSLNQATDAPLQEMVNIIAWVVDRTVEHKSDYLLQEDRVKVHLRIADHSLPGISTFSCYLQHGPYPLGLVPGSPCSLTSVLKTESKKGQIYFQSTSFTCVQPLLTKERCEFDQQEVPLTLPPSSPHLLSGQGVQDLVFSLERVLSLQLVVECKGCSSPVTSGRCSYAGCNMLSPSCHISAKVTCLVLVKDSFVTLICSTLSDIKLLLSCSDRTWDELETVASRTESGTLSLGHNLLEQVVRAAVTSPDFLGARVRRFSGTKFFCLRLFKLTVSQLNSIYEKSLDS